jgi:hypothetical protein
MVIDMKDFHKIFPSREFQEYLAQLKKTSWGGIAGAIWGITSSVASELGGGAKGILEDRGAYLPRDQVFKTNRSITVRTPFGNLDMSSNVLKGLKGAGTTLGIAGLAYTGYQAVQDWRNGKRYSAIARIAVTAVAAGVSRAPYVGVPLSLGIGVADAIWGEEFYEWVEEEMSK